MAGIKRTITGKDSSKTVKGTNSADEFLFKDGAVQVTVKALKGNDKFTVNGGFYHKIYADAGKDSIKLNKGDYITVYGGDGNDTVTIGKKAGSQMTNFIYGGKGNDTINVYGGGNVKSYGTYTNGQWAYGGAGKDKITVFKGNSHTVNGDAGDDKIIIKAGNEHLIGGGSGNDTITVSKGNKQFITGDGGNDKITIKAGNDDFISGGAGKDTITVNKGKRHEIYGGSGNDIISLKGGNASFIQSDDGNDTVKISGGASVSDEQPPNHDPGLGTGAGNDKVIIYADAGKVAQLCTGTGDDTIYIRGGSGHEVHTGEGTDTVEVTGGNNLKIYLDDGNNALTLSNANTTTVYTGAYSVDTVTIKWTQGKQNGNYQIITPFLVSDIAPHYTDRLIVRGAKSTDFNYSYANDTLTMSNSYGSLSVDQLFTPFDFRNAFKGGITFDDGSVSVADLGKKVGVKG